MRYDYIDVARGLSVFFMIVVHSYEEYVKEDDSIIGTIVGFFGSAPAAPVFMFLMGFSFCIGTNKGFKRVLFRGIGLIFKGYLLSLIMATLLLLISKLGRIDVFKSKEDEKNNLITIVLTVDILQFAGVAQLVLFALSKVAIWVNIAIILIVSAVSHVLWDIKVNNPIFSYFLGYLWGNKPTKGFIPNLYCFPIFPWIAFPLSGVVFYQLMSKTKNSFKNALSIGFLICISGLITIIRDPGYQINDYFHSRFGAIIGMIGFVIVWLCLCNNLSQFRILNPIKQILAKWSRDTTRMYFIQCILITLGIVPFGINTQSPIVSFMISLQIVISSTFINNSFKLC